MRAPTLFDARSRDAILARLARLTPAAAATWGKFTAPRMICHVAAPMQQGLGVLQYKHLDHHLRQFGC